MPLPKDNMLFGFATKLTEEQKIYVDAIFDYDLVMCNAKAGSGKTTLAVACAKLIGKDLVYVFSPVEETKMGYRPGSQQEKESAYIQPLKDALLEINENPIQVIFNEDLMSEEVLKKKGKSSIMQNVWVYPKSHIFARGTNLKNCTVIIDEAQNLKLSEMKKILTRIHDNCKVIVIGHSEQVDIPKDKSGFVPYIEHFKNQPYAKICTLTKNFRGKIADWADEMKW